MTKFFVFEIGEFLTPLKKEKKDYRALLALIA